MGTGRSVIVSRLYLDKASANYLRLVGNMLLTSPTPDFTLIYTYVRSTFYLFHGTHRA